MAKKTKDRLYKEARELYLNTDLKLTDIAEQLGIKINTLYTISNREQWSLLKEEKIKEIISDRNIMLNDRKLKSIEFYDSVMYNCKKILDDGEIRGKELKSITETHIMAESRLFLLSKHMIETKKEEDNNDGILNELANM